MFDKLNRSVAAVNPDGTRVTTTWNFGICPVNTMCHFPAGRRRSTLPGALALLRLLPTPLAAAEPAFGGLGRFGAPELEHVLRL